MRSYLKRMFFQTSCCVCYLIVVFFLATLIQGCGGGSTNVIPYNSSQHITEKDFDVTPDQWPEMVFRYELDDVDEFKVSNAAVLSEQEEEVSCIFNVMGTNATYNKVDDYYEFSINDTDFTNCFDISGLPDYSVTASYYISKIRILDQDGNLVELDKILLGDIEKYQITESNIRIYVHVSYKYNINQQVYVYNWITKSSDHQTQHFNEPCPRKSVITNCTYIEAERLDITNYPNSIVSLIDLHTDNLTVESRKPYFTNGNIIFTFNNWTGTMTYDDDGDTPPTYEATDGANIIQGTYGETRDHTHSSITTAITLEQHAQRLRRGVYITLDKTTQHLKTLR